MAYYPTSIPNTSNYPDRVDDIDWLYAARYNEIKSEVIALCAELGISPSGIYATVKARLDALGEGYVDRGDPAGPDFSVGDLTTDGAFHDLDLSALVPAGAKLVLVRAVVTDELVGQIFQIKEKGNSNNYNASKLNIQVTNVSYYSDLIAACDNDRIIQYYASTGVWTTIDLTIGGWWI